MRAEKPVVVDRDVLALECLQMVRRAIFSRTAIKTDLVVRPIAERLVFRCTAAAQRHDRLDEGSSDALRVV